MTAVKRSRRLFVSCLAILLASHASAPAAEMAGVPSLDQAASARGRQLYLTGSPADGARLVASVGQPAMEVPAGVLKCVNCHGRDGRGRPEGGLTPSDIRARELAKPHGRTAGGRERTAYDGKLLVRAITTGLDSAGHALDPAMPRYRLTHEQAADLASYLGLLGDEPEPGVTDTTIRLGVVLPPPSFHGSADSIRRLLTAYINQVNMEGGFFGREVRLAFVDAPEETEAREGVIRAYLDQEQPFALVSSYLVGCEDAVGQYLEQIDMLSVGPIALFASDDAVGRRHTFHLLAGLAGQSEALARFARILPPSRSPIDLIVRRGGDDEVQSLAEMLSKRLAETAGVSPQEVVIEEDAPPEWPALLQGDKVGAVFWFAGSGGLREFYRAAQAAACYPYLFAPSVLAGPELWSAPATFSGRIYCSMPAISSDQTAAGRREVLRLAGDADAAEGILPRVALSAAKLVVHGLREAGRELTREKLMGILENVYGFETEQTPPLTFNRHRHVGAEGAYVAGVDPQRKALVEPVWIPLH